MPKTRGHQAHPEGPKITVGPEERTRIKEMREKRGLLQKELATRARTTQGTISNLESGRHEQIYLKVYQRILGVLNIEGEAHQANEYYDRIVAGAANLPESEKKMVASFIEMLEKTRAK